MKGWRTTFFFCSKLLENVYCIVQCFQDMCTDFLFGDTMI